MRFNDRELVKISEGRGDIQGILHHMRPQENDWSDWYQQPSFKERTFKLVLNLLFYYRINEQEPLGILVLENAQVAYERPHRGIPFAFSITFKINDKYKDSDRKHIFSCRCQEDVNKWVSFLKVASYEHWRSQYAILKTKISMRTGKDPISDYVESKYEIKEKQWALEKQFGPKKSTFQSHIESSTINYVSKSINDNSVIKGSIFERDSETISVDTLIDI